MAETYREAVNKAFELIETERSGQDFKEVKKVNVGGLGELSLMHREREGVPLGVYRVQATMPGSAAACRRALWAPEAATRDHNRIMKLEVIEDLGPDLRVVHELQSITTPISNREFLYAQSWKQEGDTYMLCTTSTEHPKVPIPEDGSFVRGEMWAGFVMEQLDADTLRVTNTGYIDPKGDIPLTIVEMFTDRMCFFADRVRQVLTGETLNFKVLSEKGIGLRNGPAFDKRVTKEESAAYGEDIPGGKGLAHGAEIRAVSVDGEYPYEHTPAWVQFKVKRLMMEDRTFWVPTHNAKGDQLIERTTWSNN